MGTVLNATNTKQQSPEQEPTLTKMIRKENKAIRTAPLYPSTDGVGSVDSDIFTNKRMVEWNGDGTGARRSFES